jgi:hypothetical protein
MKRSWIVGGCLVAMFASALFARQGVVITQDGKRYPGDIVERGGTIDIVQADPKGRGGKSTVSVQKPNVKDIIYADQVAEQVRKELARVDRRDVRRRIELAQFAMQSNAYDVARDVLEEAQAIEPDNRQVKTLLETVNAEIRMNRGEKPMTAPSAAVPATQPATPTAEASGPSTRPTQSVMAKRLVTPDEINHIRQVEWDRKEQVRVKVDNDARQRFVAGGYMTQAEFGRLSADQQAAVILDKGKPELADGVHILNDPATVAEFKTRVQKVIVAGCAANGCHGGANAKGGTFFLVSPGTNDQQAYTNFLVLQTYTKNIDKAQRSMVDREFPDKSLLLQYMLPGNVADTAHPQVANLRPIARTTSDLRFRQTQDWLHTLSAVLPDYGIDLTQEPTTKKPKGTK